MSEESVFPLARVNARIQAVVEQETLDKPLWTGGFVQHVYLADSGHIYFTLADGDYSIRCMLSESKRGSIPFTPQDGMEVEAYGTIRVFDQRATVEIAIDQMRLLEGQAMSNYESAEDRLDRMGLLPRAKKAIPTNPRSIRLVTSKSSEALSDFRQTYHNRGGTAATPLTNVLLEGDFAAQRIADAINRINQEESADVIVLTRGGGRRQTLAVFDDFLVAEAICRSNIPIITAIGHADNNTLADEVADKRADTPTAAATLLADLQRQQQSQVSSPQPFRLTFVQAALVAVAILLFVILIVVVLNLS